MDVGTIITRLSKSLNAYDEKVIEEVDNLLWFDVIGESVLELRKILKRPIKEADITMTTGQRGVNLPSDWLEFADTVVPVRIEVNGQSSEGVSVELIPEHDVDY